MRGGLARAGSERQVCGDVIKKGREEADFLVSMFSGCSVMRICGV